MHPHLISSYILHNWVPFPAPLFALFSLSCTSLALYSRQKIISRQETQFPSRTVTSVSETGWGWKRRPCAHARHPDSWRHVGFVFMSSEPEPLAHSVCSFFNVCDVYWWCRRCLSVLPLPSHYWICSRGNVAFISTQDVMDSRWGEWGKRNKRHKSDQCAVFLQENTQHSAQAHLFKLWMQTIYLFVIFFFIWYNTGTHNGIQV